ncbi:MAG TPA: 2-dehydropantoate 2-reductase N-terminal domain-containing protein [Gaiellaceae bacterium]|jgi:2-dehydropantoate 2-reductase
METRHAILGAGGIGGLLAGALARSGADVVLLLRPEALARYPGRLTVESAVLGDFEVDVPGVPLLDRPVDVVWVATKATQLEAALRLAPVDQVGSAVVIPLLNGVDHMRLLRSRYRDVVAGAVRVESERLSPTVIRQSSPFLRVELAGAEAAQGALGRAGIECRTRDDEISLLWDKLTFLAPFALATSVLDAPLGVAREDPRFVGCREEALAIARAEGAQLDGDALRKLHEGAPASLRSSMQKDLAAGREPELDAIAGPILRGGKQHGLPTESTQQLVSHVRARRRS